MLKRKSTLVVGSVSVVAAVVVLLVVMRANWEPSRPDYKMDTMHQLTRFRELDIIENEYQELVDRGEHIDRLDDNGCTPLYHAVFHDNLTAVQFMLQHGADPNLCDNKCSAPIIWAARGVKPENLPIVKALIEAGAEINVVDRRDGKAPLHCAASTGNFEVAQLLIQSGADVNTINTRENSTPLLCAVLNGHARVADLLLASGADPELRNARGSRAIDHIDMCPNPAEIQAVFRSHGADEQRRPELIEQFAAEDE